MLRTVCVALFWLGVSTLALSGCSVGERQPERADASAPGVQRSEPSAGPTQAPPADWLEALQTFRSQREQSLRSPDGWMALVGLHWLEPGEHGLGSAEANAVRLAVGPARLGRFELVPEAMALRLDLDEGVRVLRDGAGVASREILILADKTETPTRLDFPRSPGSPFVRGSLAGLHVQHRWPALRLFAFTLNPSCRARADLRARPGRSSGGRRAGRGRCSPPHSPPRRRRPR